MLDFNVYSSFDAASFTLTSLHPSGQKFPNVYDWIENRAVCWSRYGHDPNEQSLVSGYQRLLNCCATVLSNYSGLRFLANKICQLISRTYVFESSVVNCAVSEAPHSFPKGMPVTIPSICITLIEYSHNAEINVILAVLPPCRYMGSL